MRGAADAAEDVEVARNRITELLSQGKPLAEARALAASVTDRWPSEPQAWLLLAATHVGGYPGSVSRYVTRATGLAPDDPQVQLDAADLLIRNDQFSDAEEILRRTRSKLAPDDLARGALLLELAGRVQHHRGDLPRAERALCNAVDAAPDSVRHAVALSDFYAQEGRIRDAQAALVRAGPEATSHAAITDRLAALAERLG